MRTGISGRTKGLEGDITSLVLSEFKKRCYRYSLTECYGFKTFTQDYNKRAIKHLFNQ